MNIEKCIIVKGNGKIPQTLKHFFRPIYTDVLKKTKIKTSDMYGLIFVSIRELFIATHNQVRLRGYYLQNEI